MRQQPGRTLNAKRVSCEKIPLNLKHMPFRQTLTLQIAAKPLQIATWSADSHNSNSSSPYLTVPPLTPYDVPFSHNTCVILQTTGRGMFGLRRIVHKCECPWVSYHSRPKLGLPHDRIQYAASLQYAYRPSSRLVLRTVRQSKRAKNNYAVVKATVQKLWHKRRRNNDRDLPWILHSPCS